MPPGPHLTFFEHFSKIWPGTLPSRNFDVVFAFTGKSRKTSVKRGSPGYGDTTSFEYSPIL